MLRRGQIQMFHDRGSDIAEPDLTDCADTVTIAQNGNALARVVCPGPAWIVTMIGGENGKIPGPQPVGQAFHDGVKPFQLRRITGNVPPMAEIRVEFDEIGESQAARLGLLPQAKQMIREIGIRFSLVQTCDAAMAENITYLADGMRHPPRLMSNIEDRGGRWGNGEIAAVRCTFELR